VNWRTHQTSKKEKVNSKPKVKEKKNNTHEKTLFNLTYYHFETKQKVHTHIYLSQPTKQSLSPKSNKPTNKTLYPFFCQELKMSVPLPL